MNIKIENLSVEDISEINYIQKLAFKDSYEKYKYCPAYETTDDQIITFLEKATGYKILIGDRIIGSIFVCRINDKHYELNTISIAPKFQNAGIGNQVVTQIEKRHPNVLIWTLSTPDGDARNRHFYEKLAYIQIGSEFINNNLTLIEYKKNL